MSATIAFLGVPAHADGFYVDAGACLTDIESQMAGVGIRFYFF